jgi:hypothetical protein
MSTLSGKFNVMEDPLPLPCAPANPHTANSKKIEYKKAFFTVYKTLKFANKHQNYYSLSKTAKRERYGDRPEDYSRVLLIKNRMRETRRLRRMLVAIGK